MHNSKFSVLMSVYYKENPLFLHSALASIANQTILPNEIILVKDGKLGTELEQIIHEWEKKIGNILRIISLDKNRGLGQALNVGLEHCTYEWIARMDSDDIALPERFEKQFAYLVENSDLDILGSWICEFDNDPAVCSRERRVPASHKHIVTFARYRNPLNHMTVVFRKGAVEEAGGYMPMNGFEDYFLWMRMLMKGKRFANLSEVLVKARTGQGMIARRQGWQYAKDELALEKAAYHLGFWSSTDVVKNFFIRFIPRLLPVFAVEKLYNLLRKI